MKHLPEKKYLSSLVVVVLLLSQILVPIAALAAPPVADEYNATLTEHDIRSRLGLSEDVQVVTDSQMSELIQLCHAIGAYLIRQEDGTLRLELDDASRVGVSESFLKDYRTGLEEINELIRRGWVYVDDEMNLQPGPGLPVNPNEIEAGLAEIEEQVAGEEADAALPAKESPEYHYRGFLFSFHSRRHYVPYRYASLGPTFASHFGFGRHGARFSLLFGFHRGFFGRTFRYGGYGYVPYYSSYRYGYHRFYYYTYPYRYWRYRYLYY